MENFSFTEIEKRLDLHLKAIQAIIRGGYFQSYNEDPGSPYFGQQFYYAVSPEGMELIQDPQCESAFIISKYRDGEFRYVTFYLYAVDEKLSGSYDIGMLDHITGILPHE